MAPINYAAADGYSSLAAAIIFAIVYIPFLGLYAWRYLRARTSVFLTLTIFCLTRVVGFIIRAIEINSDRAGENKNLFIADQVFFGIGFLGLLYAAYTLVLDRRALLRGPDMDISNTFERIVSNRRLFRLSLTVAVALGIAGIVSTSNGDSGNLRKVSVILFLALTVVQVILTVLLIAHELQYSKIYPSSNHSIGAQHGSMILGAMAIMFLIREIFSTATINNASVAMNEHFWYPLVAIPEIITIILYATPGLVPSREEMDQAK